MSACEKEWNERIHAFQQTILISDIVLIELPENFRLAGFNWDVFPGIGICVLLLRLYLLFFKRF